MRTYLSIPIKHRNESYYIASALREHGIQVLNPCDIMPEGIPAADMPAAIAEQCYAMIDAADAVILFADYYGRDCAAEAGYALCAGKPVYPLTLTCHSSLQLEADWMIRPRAEPLSQDLSELILRLQGAAHRAA